MPNQIVVRPPFRKRGQNWLPVSKSLLVGSVTGSGGVEIGGAGVARFVHGPQVESDIVLEWDLDNDGNFDEAVEDVTTYATSIETFTGRDWPSLLTGKAGPGRLRATFRNDDDRFNYFNTDSPLVTPPFSLKTGRKIRVRTTAAANPDPASIARDRFRRPLGPLGTDEFGTAYIEPLAADFSVFSSRAVASTEGSPHMALVDTGATDYYVQVKISVLGDASPANRVGVVYRYVNTSNYSLCAIDPVTGGVQLVDVVAGVENVLAFVAAELYSGATIGVLVGGTDVTAYLEGVPLAVATAPAGSSTAELVGFYALWATDDIRPEVDEFFVWSGVPVESEGVLWTGDVSEANSSVSAGPLKTASVAGEGWLSKLSSQEITPPASLNGRKTGLLMGNALAMALQLHPPGRIDLGTATTGPFAMPERSALAVARDVEEIEFGFLYETQEGPLSFRDRVHRDDAVSVVTFTDDPLGQFHYHNIEPYDWRKEVFNRVLAGVSPWTEGPPATLYTDPGPYNLAPGESRTIQATYDGTVVRYTGHTRDVTAPGGNPGGVSFDDYIETDPADAIQTVSVPLPAVIDANSLILIVFSTSPTNGGSGVIAVPAGFVDLALGALAVAAKVAVGTEGGTSVSFVTGGNLGSTNAVQVFIVDDWIGELSGVAVSDVAMSVLGTTYNPPPVTFPWGALPTLVIPCSYWVADLDVTADAAGYANGQLTETLSGDDLGLYSAQKIVTGMASEDPGLFTVTAGGNNAYCRTIAIQGPVATTSVSSGNPSGADPSFEIEYDVTLGGTAQTHANIVVTGIPLVQGDQTFAQADDFDSQDDHNAIRTYQAAASLFANPTDAQEYADLVLSKFANDRPIVSISFYANKSAAYRKQALARRVGDKITLIATNNAGLGISQDFFIESVGHRFSHGKTLWETTWELSPG